MMKTLLVSSLVVVAVASTAYAKTLPIVSQSNVTTLCAQGSGDQDATLKLANGQVVNITVHCASAETKVGATSDAGESEKGPTEAAENGIED